MTATHLPLGNWLDRAVAAVSPAAGLRRLQARHTLMTLGGDSYNGANLTRRAVANWKPRPTSADAATLPALVTLRANSRDLVRNNPLAGGAVAGVTTSVVGTGLSVQPQPLRSVLRMSESEAQAWGKQAKDLFELWAARAEWCDIACRLTFYGQQELAFRSALESGDVFALLPLLRYGREPFATKVQLIEADRVCNPDGVFDNAEWAAGIKCDRNGRPLLAAVAGQHPGGSIIGRQAWTQVPFFGAQSGRRNLLHLSTQLRPGQRRGVPYLAPVMEPLKQLGTYTDAEIMAAVISGAFTVFVKKPEPEASPIAPPAAASPSTGAVPPGEQNGNNIGLEGGAMIDLLPGEEVAFADPTRPNTSFDPFVMSVLRQIGVALELPFEVLIKHYTASYSAARAALLEAWRFFRKRRDWLAAGFCQPVYEAVITECVLDGRLRAPGFLRDELVRAAYLGAVWIGDAPGAIDPLKEAQAARERVELGISDKSAETVAYSGRNWEDVHSQRVRERQAEQRDGLAAAAPAAPERAPEAANPDKPDTESE
jgi:lambda family phage portal protein